MKEFYPLISQLILMFAVWFLGYEAGKRAGWIEGAAVSIHIKGIIRDDATKE